MQFPDLILEKEKLVTTFSRKHKVPLKDIRVIASPYRVSPLGAHIDHQGGPVLGMTINAYSLMAYVPEDNGQVTLRSENYPGQVKFNLQQIVSSADGVIGSRFGGGGFGGCVVGLVATDRTDNAARQIRDAYLKNYPETAGQAAVYLAMSADGVRFL